MLRLLLFELVAFLVVCLVLVGCGWLVICLLIVLDCLFYCLIVFVYRIVHIALRCLSFVCDGWFGVGVFTSGCFGYCWLLCVC